jgi:NADH:ubiquinone oxidoreductase subunit F (NADH-binding)
MLEGMIIAGYAVGAPYGLIYLRAEYTWLKEKNRTSHRKVPPDEFIG